MHQTLKVPIVRTAQRADIIAWGVIVLALIHTVLLATLIDDPYSLSTALISSLQPLAAVGAVAILFISARQSTGQWRWVWYLYGLGICFTIAGLCIQILARLNHAPIVTPMSTALYLTTYVLSITADIIALTRRAWLLGSTRRLVFDTATIGVAAFILFNTLPIASDVKTYLAFDVALLFCAIVICLRFGLNGGPLVVFGLFSAISLRAGDYFYTITISQLGQEWIFLPAPLFTLHRAFIALAAYRSLTQPPRAPDEFTANNTGEWIAWTVVPPLTLVAAFIASALSTSAPVAPALLWLLAGVGAGQIIQSALDVRRIIRVLHERRNTLTVESLAWMKQRLDERKQEEAQGE